MAINEKSECEQVDHCLLKGVARVGCDNWRVLIFRLITPALLVSYDVILVNTNSSDLRIDDSHKSGNHRRGKLAASFHNTPRKRYQRISGTILVDVYSIEVSSCRACAGSCLNRVNIKLSPLAGDSTEPSYTQKRTVNRI